MSHQQHWDDIRVQTSAAIRKLRADLERAGDGPALAEVAESAQFLAASITALRRNAIRMDRYQTALDEARKRMDGAA